MGCDIHIKIEYKLKEPKKYFYIENNIKTEYYTDNNLNWRSTDLLTGSRGFHGPRIYGMFAYLANVRNYNNIEPIVPSRGYPKDTTYNTDICYYKEIYKYSNKLPEYLTETHFISEEEAQNWVERYQAERFTKKYPGGNSAEFIMDSDYHSASWCTSSELEKCIKTVFRSEDKEWIGEYMEWMAILGIMKGIEFTGVYEARMIYWFDN